MSFDAVGAVKGMSIKVQLPKNAEGCELMPMNDD
jgi:hypothetical protein